MLHIRDSTLIGEVCKNARQRAGITRTDFAMMIGCSPSILYECEIGRNDNVMLILSYYRFFDKDDWTKILKEVNEQNAYAARRLRNGRE